MQGIAQIELWTGRSDESSSRCLTENAKNPLDLPEIREKIFKHLSPKLAFAFDSEDEKHWKDLLHCRKVCYAWQCSATDFIKISFDSDSRIESYLNLMSTNPNPDANDPTKFISTRFEFKSNAINYEGVEFISFMETCGAHIKNLSFKESGLTYYSILMLPIWCPSLIQLQLYLEYTYRVRFLGVHNFSHGTVFPKIFQSAWEKPFKLLQSLRFMIKDDVWDSDACFQVSNELFCWILFKLPKLKRQLVTSHLNFQSYFESYFETQTGVLERLECLIVARSAPKNELEILCQMNLFCLRHLVITELDMSTSEVCFYRLLENVANTLEILMVDVKKKKTDNFEFRLPFPVMHKLIAFVVHDIGQFFAPNEYYLLFQKFPIIMFADFANCTGRTSNDVWNGIFPNLEDPIDESKTFIHHHLSILVVDFLIYKASSSIVREIGQSFLGLDSLWLRVEGVVFMNLVHELRYHKIRKLAIDFYMSEVGIIAIPAALMGLDLDTCTQILDNREDYKSFEKFKVRASLSDWKHLKQLQIENNGYDCSSVAYVPNSDKAEIFSDVKINWIAVWNALTKMTQLEALSLINFKIHERLILRMLKKTNVNLHLGGCLIEMCKPQGIAPVSSEDYTKNNPRDRLFGDKFCSNSIFNEFMNFKLLDQVFINA